MPAIALGVNGVHHQDSRLAHGQRFPHTGSWAVASGDYGSGCGRSLAIYRRSHERALCGNRAGRELFNHIMERVVPPVGVTFEDATIAGITGWWGKPPSAPKEGTILHVHGGWFNWGTAQAYWNFAGHIAPTSGTGFFMPITGWHANIPSRLPFAISQDAIAGWLAAASPELLFRAIRMKVIWRCFSLPSWIWRFAGRASKRERKRIHTSPSPIVGLVQLSRESDPKNPLASRLYADLRALPPSRIQVGDGEVQLDDSLRHVEGAVAAGVDARLDL